MKVMESAHRDRKKTETRHSFLELVHALYCGNVKVLLQRPVIRPLGFKIMSLVEMLYHYKHFSFISDLDLKEHKKLNELRNHR